MTARAVLITGGARRIGAAFARAFAHAGYDIALHYRHSETEAKALADEIGARLYQAELTDTAAASTLLQAVKADFPHLNLLINNASTFRRAPLLETFEQSIAEDMAVNLIAPLNLMREFAHRVEQGQIINMLDISIHTDRPSHFAYLVAKKGLAAATEMAAREWAGHIRVNGICPGHVLPTENDPAHEPIKPDQAPTVEQVVAAALKLAESTDTTGQLIAVNGGN